ncbi:MAG TPA: CotH kinase family protein [Thermoanaerobaculia bacterium]|nr:CotH kinase family protein [Thermoanaerobaculia bacterium]HUM29754.1 CotH kinase family protein [Thermoanaerobaculia bacterium]HXK67054.1 CotH kinase family protein [Thermoanaerobaculia bacterium]
MKWMLTPFFFLSALSVLGNPVQVQDEASAFFDDSFVHEIRITFDNPDWYQVLYASHANDPEDPYFPARLSCDGVTLDPVGVRFKGNSSFGIPGVKKSIKIDFDEYDEDNDELAFFGLKKLNLNNGFKDPTLLREKLFLDFTSSFMPAIRAVHVRVYINDIYWGLYTAVEQVDKTFAQSRFGESEDGNLFKAAASDDLDAPQSDFGSDLTWEGWDPDPYHDHYQLKTNEEADDYSGLIEFIDVLNHADPGDLPFRLDPIFNTRMALISLALNNLFVNLDAYNGSAHNYFLYDRDDTGRFVHLHWDTNEAFGRFLMSVTPGEDPLEMDPFWLPSPIGPPGQTVAQERPLMENLWANPGLQNQYLCDLQSFLNQGFSADLFEVRIHELADLIRPDVYADGNKMYSNAAFEQNLAQDVVDGRDTIYGLLHFVQARASFLSSYLTSTSPACGGNLPTISHTAHTPDPPQPGQAVTITTQVTASSTLAGPCLLYRTLTGDFVCLTMFSSGGNQFQTAIPGQPEGTTIEYYILVIDENGNQSRDPEEAPESVYSYTVGTYSAIVFINEVMADNDSTITDPDGNGGYPDWFEIYNPGVLDIDLGGMYLTDDPTDPTAWQVPTGVVVEAGGFILFWADNDEEQGPTHTSFKLSADGESVGLFDTDGTTLIDLITFGPQSSDISYGRSVDGGPNWVFFDHPTPGTSNGAGRSHNRPFEGP